MTIMDKNMSCLRGQLAEKCLNFQKGCCINLDCDFVHTYKYCFKYQNTMCNDKKCQFIHCTSMEQYRYEITGKATQTLKKEVGRTLQNSNICDDFKNGTCMRPVCKLRHVKFEDLTPKKCIICTKEILENLSAIDCGHIFCLNCAYKQCLQQEDTQNMKILCTICRRIGEYKKLY